MPGDQSEILEGPLDLMVLKTLEAMGLLPGPMAALRCE